jgi:hypothetical protein
MKLLHDDEFGLNRSHRSSRFCINFSMHRLRILYKYACQRFDGTDKSHEMAGTPAYLHVVADSSRSSIMMHIYTTESKGQSRLVGKKRQ